MSAAEFARQPFELRGYQREAVELPSGIRERIQIEPNTGCWLWAGSLTKDGYGSVSRYSYGVNRIHQLTFTLLVGGIPDGLEIHHKCGVRRCANPTHMQLLTHVEHMTLRLACPKGHSFEGANLYIDPRGNRQCRACRAKAQRRYEKRRANALRA